MIRLIKKQITIYEKETARLPIIRQNILEGLILQVNEKGPVYVRHKNYTKKRAKLVE